MHIGGKGGAIEGAMAGRVRIPTTLHHNTLFIDSSLILDSIPSLVFGMAWPDQHLIGQSSEPRLFLIDRLPEHVIVNERSSTNRGLAPTCLQ